MNYDPTKYKYEIVPAPAGQSGVQVLLTRLETGVVRTFPAAVHGVDSVGLHNHMQSMTDELMLDFFEKGKKKKKDKKGNAQ